MLKKCKERNWIENLFQIYINDLYKQKIDEKLTGQLIFYNNYHLLFVKIKKIYIENSIKLFFYFLLFFIIDNLISLRIF